MSDDEEDDERINIFEDGHWTWDDFENSLKFISHKIIIDDEDEPPPPVSDDISFRRDIDLLEQVLFKKKFYRKVQEGDNDVIVLQDIKDFVLFTAPKGNLTFKLINTLHTCAYERFLRTLIVYTQYYIQVRNVMDRRMADGAKKIRLPASDIKERVLEESLADFRSLVAREYLYLHLGTFLWHFGKEVEVINDLFVSLKFCNTCILKIQTSDDSIRKNKRLSLIDVETRYTEMLIRISIQVVWIALLRPDFDLIDTELNRVFRSQAYNVCLHKSYSEIPEISIYEKAVFYRERKGDVVQKDKYKAMSPAAKDLLLHKQDYRLVGIGLIGYQSNYCTERIEYLDDIFCTPEEKMITENIHIGILGEPRNKYDMMLKEILTVAKTGGSSKSALSLVRSKSAQQKSSISKKSKWTLASGKTFEVPPPCDTYKIPVAFPEIPPLHRLRPVNKKQRAKWIKYIKPKPKKRQMSTISGFFD